MKKKPAKLKKLKTSPPVVPSLFEVETVITINVDDVATDADIDWCEHESDFSNEELTSYFFVVKGLEVDLYHMRKSDCSEEFIRLFVEACSMKPTYVKVEYIVNG